MNLKYEVCHNTVDEVQVNQGNVYAVPHLEESREAQLQLGLIEAMAVDTEPIHDLGEPECGTPIGDEEESLHGSPVHLTVLSTSSSTVGEQVELLEGQPCEARE